MKLFQSLSSLNEVGVKIAPSVNDHRHTKLSPAIQKCISQSLLIEAIFIVSAPMLSPCLQEGFCRYKFAQRRWFASLTNKVHILSQGAYSLARCIFFRIDNAQCRVATAQAVIVCPFSCSSLLWTWFVVCTLYTPFIRLSAKTAGHACTASQTFKPYF